MSSMIRISAAHFVAGLVLDENDVVVRAAPILKYMIGWSWQRVLHYCTIKRWTCELS